mgnify:CR=1 FL=1
MKELLVIKNNIEERVSKIIEGVEVPKITNDKELKELSSVRADLNKNKNEINKERIDLAKKLKEYVDNALLPIDNLISDCDTEIKRYNDIYALTKTAEIEKYYDTLNSPVELSKLWDERYLNKTFNNWEEDLKQKVEKVNADLEIIKLINDSEDFKKIYLKHLDITQAKEEYDRLNAPKAKVATGAELNTYNISFKATEEQFNRIVSFINALGIDINELVE